MPPTPVTAMARNHTTITGPKSRPTAPVPFRCPRNSPTMTTTVIGTTQGSSEGSTTLSPSTADSTEIAGVIMLSPKKSDAPKMPSAANAAATLRRPGAVPRRIRVMSARMPPSPSLSARMTSTT